MVCRGSRLVGWLPPLVLNHFNFCDDYVPLSVTNHGKVRGGETDGHQGSVGKWMRQCSWKGMCARREGGHYHAFQN